MLKSVSVPRSASVLIVEDSIARRGWFLSHYRVPQAFLSDDCGSAIRIIRQFQPDVIFLDFDLALGITSEPIALYLQQTNYAAEVIIHSDNQFGRELLGRILPNAKIKPFGSFEILRKS